MLRIINDLVHIGFLKTFCSEAKTKDDKSKLSPGIDHPMQQEMVSIHLSFCLKISWYESPLFQELLAGLISWAQSHHCPSGTWLVSCDLFPHTLCLIIGPVCLPNVSLKDVFVSLPWSFYFFGSGGVGR